MKTPNFFQQVVHQGIMTCGLKLSDWTLAKKFLMRPEVQYWNMSPRDAVECPPLETFQTWLFIAPSTPTWWWLAKPAINPGLDDLQRFSTESVTVYPVGSSDIENLEKKIKDLGLDHIFIYMIWGHLVLGTYHSAMMSSYPYVLSHRRCQNIWEILPYLQKKKKKLTQAVTLAPWCLFFGQQTQRKNGIVGGTILRSLHLYFPCCNPKVFPGKNKQSTDW